MKPFQSMRDFMLALEEKGDLACVTKEVDKNWEISTVARQTSFAFPLDQRPALLFKNIKCLCSWENQPHPSEPLWL